MVFEDFNGYDEKELSVIFRKSILLESMRMKGKEADDSRFALLLCGAGLICILISIFVCNAWQSESIVREIVVHVLDIMATVPFWGAMDIYFVSYGERRQNAVNLVKRFHGVRFFHEQNNEPQDTAGALSGQVGGTTANHSLMSQIRELL